MFYRTDINGRLILVSPSITKILGYTLEEVMGMDVSNFYLHPELRNDFLKTIESVGFIENYEIQLKKKDGAVIWISSNSHHYFDNNENILGVEGMIRDITERKNAEEMLQDEKERLSITLRSISDGVITTDINRKVILINKMAENLTGWTQEDAAGRDFNEIFTIIDGNTREHIDGFFQKVIKGENYESAGNIVLIDRNKTEHFVENSAAAIRDKDSRIVGTIIVFRDISEKRKLEIEILKKQKLESIGIFAGGIAHDFNNILTGILGNISIAKIKVKEDISLLKNLSEAEKASLRARDLTQQLLTFSKGGNPIKKTASITDLLMESVKFILSGSNIKSDFSSSQDIWPVDVDEGQINQVINNIIINATQAMKDGGTIHIIIQNISITAPNKMMMPKGNYVKISIRDEGTGIPKENLSKIFDPFFTTKSTGNGLGLATSYSIIKKHDGFIDVESLIGVGTIFTIYLPASEKQLSIIHENKIEDINTKKGKILIMDDEEMVLQIAADMLEFLGFEVVKSANGDDAVKKYKQESAEGKAFDAVIMDLTIPGGMGGKDAIRILKMINPDLQAFVSSGYSNDPVMADYKKYGLSGVIIKPYRIEELAAALKKLKTI